MTYTRKLGRTLGLAAMLATAAPALTAQAAIYDVYGRVFAADVLTGGEPYPDGQLLSDDVENQPESVLGSDNYAAVEPRGMVRVQAIDPATGNPIAAPRDAVFGAFYMRLNLPGPTQRVRFRILAMDSADVLHETRATEISAGSTLRYILTSGGNSVGTVTPSLDNTALFTRVGRVEAAHINADGFAEYGTAPAVYQNAPFGAGLRLFGGFSPDYYPDSASGGQYCYTIEVTPEGESAFNLTAPLRKRRYQVHQDGTVTSRLERLGPYQLAGQSHCYFPTPISQAGGVFWSQPDLLAQWNTRSLSGAHTVRIRLFDTFANAANREIALSPSTANDPEAIKLFLDNTRVTLRFDQVSVQAGGGTTETDLLNNRCEIAQLMGSRNLAIDYTASHASGYLARYGLSLRANDGTGVPGERGAYDGGLQAGTDTPEAFEGRTTTGFGPVTRDHDDFPTSCAYVVSISAVARTTNGYSRPYRAHRQLFYYIQPQ